MVARKPNWKVVALCGGWRKTPFFAPVFSFLTSASALTQHRIAEGINHQIVFHFSGK